MMKKLIYLTLVALAITAPTTAFAQKDLIQLTEEHSDLIDDMICEGDLTKEDIKSELRDEDLSGAELEELASAALAAQENMTLDQKNQLCD